MPAKKNFSSGGGADAGSLKQRRFPPDGLMKAVIRDGEGSHPAEGDQVIFHCTIRSAEGVLCHSTRSDQGGLGTPHRKVLGKSRIVGAVEHGLTIMRPGEICMLKVKPEHHYGEEGCQVAPPSGVPADVELLFELELLEACPVKVLSEDCGITKQVLREGCGWEQPRPPYEVECRVQGRVLGGEVFFKTSDSFPLHFTFGKDEVPTGLETAIGAMVRAESAVIYVSRKFLTGGSSKVPPPPAAATDVEFLVDLLKVVQVRDMLGDGGVIKRRLTDGQGEFPVDCPMEDAMVRVHYRGTLPDLDGRAFLDTRKDNTLQSPHEFGTGEGLVPEALDMAVRLMLPGETALITSTAKYAFDNFPRPEGVPAGARVQWEVELIGFDRPKDWSTLTFAEIMEEAEHIKDLGNGCFRRGRFDLAKTKYEKLLRELLNVHPHDDGESRTLSALRNSVELNVAACWQRLEDYVKAIQSANKVLEGDPMHPKALFRRGTAFSFTGDFAEARRDFELMAQVDPSSKADAESALIKLRKREQEANDKAKKQFKGLFDKKPGELSHDDPVDEGEDAERGNEEIADDIREGEMHVRKADSPITGLLRIGKQYLKSLSHCTIL